MSGGSGGDWEDSRAEFFQESYPSADRASISAESVNGGKQIFKIVDLVKVSIVWMSSAGSFFVLKKGVKKCRLLSSK